MAAFVTATGRKSGKGKVEASKWGWGQAAEPMTVLRVALLEKAEKARFE